MGFGSTIKPKTGVCIDCKDGIFKRLTAGRCSFHYQMHRAKVCAERKKSRIAPTDALEKTFGMGKPQSELYLWFAKKMKESEPVCENCGCKINKYNQEEWHGGQAHIVPKSLFDSVKTHPDNHMILCRYGNFCHSLFDGSWLAAEKMPVFKIAKERFKKFEHLIAPEERRRIPECFLKD